MRIDFRDLACGAVFVAIGAYFAISALTGLRVGRALDMGPGYFPLTLGVVLMGLGAVIGFRSIGRPSEALGAVSWRGVSMVMLAILFFALSVRPLGMGPSFFIATVLAAFATRQATLRTALGLGAALTVFTIGLFIYALRMNYRVFGPLITG